MQVCFENVRKHSRGGIVASRRWNVPIFFGVSAKTYRATGGINAYPTVRTQFVEKSTNTIFAALKKNCHCEPARTLVWQSPNNSGRFVRAFVRFSYISPLSGGLPHQSADWFAMTALFFKQQFVLLPGNDDTAILQEILRKGKGFVSFFPDSSAFPPPRPPLPLLTPGRTCAARRSGRS